MSKRKIVLIIADDVFSIPQSKVSFMSLIKHNCGDSLKDFSFKYINLKSTDDLSLEVSKRLEDLKKLTIDKTGMAFVLCGLHECEHGYKTPIFETQIKSIIYDLDEANFDITFINPIIEHGIKGKIGGWFKRASNVISKNCKENYCNQINTSINLKINENSVILDVGATRNIVADICDYIIGD